MATPLISNVIFGVKDTFLIQLLDGPYDYVSVHPPLVLDSTFFNVIGVAVRINRLEYKIYYSATTYGGVTIRFPISSVLAIKGTTRVTNDAVFDATTSRNTPTITFDVPSNVDPIDFETGIYVPITSDRYDLADLPIVLDPLIPSVITTSNNLFYDSGTSTIRFYPEREETYESEWFRIVPIPSLTSIGGTYTLITDGTTTVYNITTSFPPMVLLNPGYNNIGTTYIRNNILYAPYDYINTIITKLNVSSADNNPTFTLNTNDTYFSIDPITGVITTISNQIPFDNTLTLDIVVTNTIGETITVTIEVSLYSMLSNYYITRFDSTDICVETCERKRCINMWAIPCLPDGESTSLHLYNNKVSNLLQVSNMLMSILDYMVANTIDQSFVSSIDDIANFGQVLIGGSRLGLRDFYLNYYPTNIPGSLLEKKLEALTHEVFISLQRFINNFIHYPQAKMTPCIETSFGKIIIK